MIGKVPHGHWNTSTFIAGLRSDGMIAPCVFDCAMDAELFLAYVEQQLAPALQPEDIVIADNLRCHKLPGVEKALAARGASILYLPPYSPDMNPIELAFAKLKQGLRTAAARTREALWETLGKLVSTFSSSSSLKNPLVAARAAMVRSVAGTAAEQRGARAIPRSERAVLLHLAG